MSNADSGFDDLFAESNARAPRRRRGRTAIVLVVLAIILAVIAVWADGAARAAAEDVVESELADRLPAGAGATEARIGGFAFLPQFFSGTLDDIDVAFALDGDSIPALDGDSGAASGLQIADGVMTKVGAVAFLGMEIGYTVTLEPSVEGGAVVLTPTTVEANTENASVDLSQLVDLGALTVRACAASLLPQSMELTSVEVVGSQLHFAVSGHHVPVNLAELKTRGSCE
ncbi:MAG TPA: LmeA family phospholipid-binding protein [Homoserinimonas sp.]|nr:LmeA family phospholipid-binding protein [Homoserinimonas sp.]